MSEGMVGGRRVYSRDTSRPKSLALIQSTATKTRLRSAVIISKLSTDKGVKGGSRTYC